MHTAVSPCKPTGYGSKRAPRIRFLLTIAPLALVLGVSGTISAQTTHEELVVESGITELRALMEQGKLDAEAITRACLARIERHDGALRSVLAINPDAIAQARDLDEERSNGQNHPILSKDSVQLAEFVGHHCTEGRENGEHRCRRCDGY